MMCSASPVTPTKRTSRKLQKAGHEASPGPQSRRPGVEERFKKRLRLTSLRDQERETSTIATARGLAGTVLEDSAVLKTSSAASEISSRSFSASAQEPDAEAEPGKAAALL